MSRLNILLFGEGAHDLGTDLQGGAVTVFLERVLERECGFPSAAIEITNRELVSVRKHSGGWAGKVRAAMAESRAEGFSGTAVVTDRDRMLEKLRDLQSGRQLARDAGLVEPCAIGCPVETLESWLMGDATTLAELYGAHGVPPSPEGLAGAPGSPDHPKVKLGSLMDISATTYADIARAADLDRLTKTSKSFGDFRAEVRGEFTPRPRR